MNPSPPSKTVIVTATLCGGPLSLQEVNDALLTQTEGPSAVVFESIKLLGSNRIRISFSSAKRARAFVQLELMIRGQPVKIEPVCLVRKVLLKSLPYGIPQAKAHEVLQTYGVICKSKMIKYNRVFTGDRTYVMELCSHIPSKIYILGHPCFVFYPNQPRTCFICNASDHFLSACPFRKKRRSSKVKGNPSMTSHEHSLSQENNLLLNNHSGKKSRNALPTASSGSIPRDTALSPSSTPSCVERKTGESSAYTASSKEESSRVRLFSDFSPLKKKLYQPLSDPSWNISPLDKTSSNSPLNSSSNTSPLDKIPCNAPLNPFSSTSSLNKKSCYAPLSSSSLSSPLNEKLEK